MQNKYIFSHVSPVGTSIVFGVLLFFPFHQANAGVVLCDSFVGPGSISTFCNDPFGDVDTSPRPLYNNSELQQIQSNQTTENRLKSQYGYTAYSQCMSTSFDKGNPYQVAIHLNAAEPCIASYKSTQVSAQAAKDKCMQGNGRWIPYGYGTIGYPSGDCQCSAGYQLSNGSCILQQTEIDACKTSYGPYSYTGTNSVGSSGCKCLQGSDWGTWNGKLGCAPKSTNQTAPTQTPTCTANATYNGSQCVCNTGYFSDKGACITGTQSCISNYGSNSVYNGADNSCGCTSGFEWNSGQTACIKTATVVVPTVNQIIKNDSVAPSASNGISKVVGRVNNSTSTEATTTRPTTPQKGFFSRLLHALNPFSWF